MIIYNVTVKVEKEIAREWVTWMKEEHMPVLMKTGLFTDYRLSRLLEQDESEGVTYSAQYFCKDLDDYHTYLNEHASHMRQDAFDRFGNRIIAFRSVMEIEA